MAGQAREMVFSREQPFCFMSWASFMLSGCMMTPPRSFVVALQGPKPVGAALMAFIPGQHALRLVPSCLSQPALETVSCQNASMLKHASCRNPS